MKNYQIRKASRNYNSPFFNVCISISRTCYGSWFIMTSIHPWRNSNPLPVTYARLSTLYVSICFSWISFISFSVMVKPVLFSEWIRVIWERHASFFVTVCSICIFSMVQFSAGFFFFYFAQNNFFWLTKQFENSIPNEPLVWSNWLELKCK